MVAAFKHSTAAKSIAYDTQVSLTVYINAALAFAIPTFDVAVTPILSAEHTDGIIFTTRATRVMAIEPTHTLHATMDVAVYGERFE